MSTSTESLATCFTNSPIIGVEAITEYLPDSSTTAVAETLDELSSTVVQATINIDRQRMVKFTKTLSFIIFNNSLKMGMILIENDSQILIGVGINVNR